MHFDECYAIMIKQITKRQFDAYCYCREPLLRHIAAEVAWYASEDNSLLGTVTMDFTDKDFGFVILGRDVRKVFRAVTISTKFYQEPAEAGVALIKRMEEIEKTGQKIWTQGDEKTLPNELFIPQAEEKKLHPYFKMVVDEGRYEAARELMKEIAYSYIDVDGNYVKDFQTTGFDARLWELYLYVFLHTEGYVIDRKYSAPDYLISYYGLHCAIEAVTVNANPSFDEPPPQNPEEIIRLSRDYMPIKFGSPLYSKLQKKYWEQPHVIGKPLIFAIHDFHQPGTKTNLGSMTWTRGALMDYLYGVRLKYEKDEDGTMQIAWDALGKEPVPQYEDIEMHTWKGKTIPSNFFAQPDAENVSAVLFTNGATISTFNRMGKLAGLGSKEVRMIRHTIRYDPDSTSYAPLVSVEDIDDPGYEEAWGDGLVMYHNPYAKYPVDIRMFSSVSHIFFNPETKETYSIPQPYAVLQSFTMVFEAAK